MVVVESGEMLGVVVGMIYSNMVNVLVSVICECCKGGFVFVEKIVNSNGELYYE